MVDQCLDPWRLASTSPKGLMRVSKSFIKIFTTYLLKPMPVKAFRILYVKEKTIYLPDFELLLFSLLISLTTAFSLARFSIMKEEKLNQSIY